MVSRDREIIEVLNNEFKYMFTTENESNTASLQRQTETSETVGRDRTSSSEEIGSVSRELVMTFLVLTGDNYKIGQSSMSHSFPKNVKILTKFTGFIACTVELVHTKIMLLDQVYLFQSSKKFNPNVPGI